MMSSTSWEGIFTTIRNLFHTFMFYILKSTHLYRNGFFVVFFLIIFFFFENDWKFLPKCLKKGAKCFVYFFNLFLKALYTFHFSHFAVFCKWFHETYNKKQKITYTLISFSYNFMFCGYWEIVHETCEKTDVN